MFLENHHQPETKKLLTLAELEGTRLKELRHDFRRYYHCCYDDVDPDEAIDLIQTLPRGSKYVAAVVPEAAWSEEHEYAVDVQEAIMTAAASVRGVATEEQLRKVFTRLVRPREAIQYARAKQATQERKRTIKDRLENMEWQDV